MTADTGAPPVDAEAYGAGSTPEELRDWLRQHRIEEIDCAVPDIAGVARGKTMPAEKFVKLDAVHLPISIFHQTITGDYVGFEEDGQALYAESDLMMVPDLSTIRPAPWASSPTAQVIHDATWQNGEPVEIAPRNVLKKIVALYTKKGWIPVVAPELEFYLTKTNPDPDYPLEPPVGRSGRKGAGRQAYSLGAVDEYDKIVDDVYDFAELQYLKIDTIIQEGGAAQLEINLMHGNRLISPIRSSSLSARSAKPRSRTAATRRSWQNLSKTSRAAPCISTRVSSTLKRAKTSSPIRTANRRRSSIISLQGNKFLPSAMCLLAPYVNSYRRLYPTGRHQLT